MANIAPAMRFGYLIAMPAIDDGELRAVAGVLLRAARLQSPGVEFAVHAAEQDLGKIIVELVMDGTGRGTTAILFDRGGPEQVVLLEIKS
jgi:hypothetical protein